MRTKKSLKNFGEKSMESDRLKIAAEISSKAKEHSLPVIIFETFEDMNICMEDMRLGAVVRTGYKQLNIPLEREWLQ